MFNLNLLYTLQSWCGYKFHSKRIQLLSWSYHCFGHLSVLLLLVPRIVCAPPHPDRLTSGRPRRQQQQQHRHRQHRRPREEPHLCSRQIQITGSGADFFTFSLIQALFRTAESRSVRSSIFSPPDSWLGGKADLDCRHTH